MLHALPGLPSSLRGNQSGADHGGKPALLAEIVTENRCLHHLLLCHAAPIQNVAGLQSQFADELALGSSVALAEGMQGIQCAEINSGAISERGGDKRLQMPFRCQLREYLVEVPLQEWDQREWVRRRTRDVHPPQLSRPGVDLLEDASMNGSEMGLVEAAANGIQFEVDQCRKRLSSLESVKPSQIREAMKVAEDSVGIVKMRIAGVRNVSHSLDRWVSI
jgi:hypothetical protein